MEEVSNDLQCFEWFYVSWSFLLILVHVTDFKLLLVYSTPFCNLKPSFLLGSLWTAACRLCISSCFCCLQFGQPSSPIQQSHSFGAGLKPVELPGVVTCQGLGLPLRERPPDGANHQSHGWRTTWRWWIWWWFKSLECRNLGRETAKWLNWYNLLL